MNEDLTSNEDLNSKDWSAFPKFRHNLWTNFQDDTEMAYLTVSDSQFEVSSTEAQDFFKMRTYCTGHHSRDEVIRRSGLPPQVGNAILDSLADSDILRRPFRTFEDIPDDERRETLLRACRIWSQQLAQTNIAVDILDTIDDRNVVIGWMLETYHSLKSFPEALRIASDHSTGALKTVLSLYAEQKQGHEEFIVSTLQKMGLSRAEIESSIPLVSTRTLNFLMKEMFADAPAAALLLAAIIEASDLDQTEIGIFKSAVSQKFNFPADVLDPFFERSAIDQGLGHAKLAENNAELIVFRNGDHLNATINRLHDIKHAFDLQKSEIMSYYSKPGHYLPRQFVDFFGL